MRPGPPIFLVSRFRSGSTFLWNLFRQDQRYRCFYEPLHDNLAESVETILSPQVSHRGIDAYWNEYQAGRGRLLGWHRPEFGLGGLFLHPREPYPELAGFLQKLIDAAEQDGRTCVIKCNRVDFRLAWIRKTFPRARIIHVVRNPRDQWISSVQPHKMEFWDRLEENRGYDLPLWIASLAPTWPFLLQSPPRPAYYYSYLLWKLSNLFGQRFAQHQLDFDRDIVERPARLQSALAAFFPAGFFQRPEVAALVDPPPPEGWRRFRTEEWFADLESQAEATLRHAGVYQPAFWKWVNATKPAKRSTGEFQRAVDLALLTFSRHRGDLLVHSSQLRDSLEKAKNYAESLQAEYTKASQSLQATESTKQEAENKLRLLQAVYDSLKQLHELSVASLNKTLEEFQFTTRELRQLITFKDEQIQQLTRALPPPAPTLELAAPAAPAVSPAEAEAAAKARAEAEVAAKASEQAIAQLKHELAAAQTAALSGRTLQKHLAALEQSAADLWAELTRARHEIAEFGSVRSQLEKDLAGEQLALTRAQKEVARLADLVSSHAQRISALDQSLVDRQSDLVQAHLVEHQLRQELGALREEMEGLQEASRHDRAQDHATIAQLRTDLAQAQSAALTARALEKHVTALEQSSVDTWTALTESRHQLAELGAARLELEQRHQAATTQLAEETRKSAESERVLSEMRHELAEVHHRLTEGLQRINALETELQAAQARAHRAEEHQARLTKELAAEQTGRAAEKHAYDERVSIFAARAEAARSQQEQELNALRQELAEARRQADAASARLAAINQSWAAGVVRRLVPGAFPSSKST